MHRLKRRPRVPEPILFLDVDGVLNSRDSMVRRSRSHRHYRDRDGRWSIDPRAVALLDELMRRTRARIVLSSTWRLTGGIDPESMEVVHGPERTKRALTVNGFEHAHRFIGHTPRLWGDDGNGGRIVRGHEIDAWRKEHGEEATPFAIVDDDSDMAHLTPRLVQTSFLRGLTSWDCVRLETMLSRPLPVG
jgi:hypothetical protein